MLKSNFKNIISDYIVLIIIALIALPALFIAADAITKVYFSNGGDVLNVVSGGAVTVASGGTITAESGAIIDCATSTLKNQYRTLITSQYSGTPGGATATLSLTGVKTTSWITATQNTATSAYLKSAVPGTDSIVLTWSADPSAAVVVAIQAWTPE